MIQETSKIWMDGRFVEWKEAQVHVLTHTLHYGLGVFEGIRCYRTERGPAIFRLGDHVHRLFDSAHIVQIKIPYRPGEIEKAVLSTVKTNGLTECYIRPIVFIGYGEMGLYVEKNPIQIAIAAWPWGTYLGEEGLKNGIRTKISSILRHHVNVSMTRAKVTGYYVNSQMAKREAKEAGYDEAILLDTDGYVAEGPGENIFTRDELYLAEEAFFTGTAAEVTPIREVDGRTIGNGKPGPITQLLQQDFFDVVHGKSQKHIAWLSFVS
jgi:branched-chain amino acid aminotransferase